MTTASPLLSGKYRDHIQGVLNCFDCLVLRGTLHQLCYAQGMTAYLNSRHIRIFDFAAFVRPLRNSLCKHTDELAKANNMAVEYVRKSSLNKEERVQQILKIRGTHPGLVQLRKSSTATKVSTFWRKTMLRSCVFGCAASSTLPAAPAVIFAGSCPSTTPVK